jgi:hypothetical protein
MPASLVAAGNVSPSGVSYGWARSIAWVALGAAACLVLTMALRTTPPGNVPGGGPIAADSAAKPAVKIDGQNEHHLLAVLFPEESSDVVVTDFAATISTDAGFEDDANSLEPMPEATAPDWLLAAVVEDGTPNE